MTNYMGTTIKNPDKARFDGEDNDEEIYYILRESYLTVIPWLAITGVMVVMPIIFDFVLVSFKFKGMQVLSPGLITAITLFWYLGTFGFFLQNLMNWFYNVYIITNKKIVDIDFHGIMYKNISETTLDNIEDVTSTVVGPLGTIFNIGSVYIQTAAEKREFEFTNVSDPSMVRDLISDLSSKRRHDANN